MADNTEEILKYIERKYIDPVRDPVNWLWASNLIREEAYRDIVREQVKLEVEILERRLEIATRVRKELMK